MRKSDKLENIKRVRVNLQQLVYHELGHAVFNIGHIIVPLMTQGKNSLSNSPETLDKLFFKLSQY